VTAVLSPRVRTVVLSAAAAVLLAGALPSAPWASRDRQRPRPGDIVVANLRSSSVTWFEGRTGEYVGALVEPGAGGLQGATGVAFGPDGDLFVGSSRNHQVLRFDGGTGEPRGAFVAGGALETPFSLVFGPDGDLYVSSGTGNRVLRYDGRTGRLRGVAAEGDGLVQPIGLAFGPADRLLYVVNSAGRSIMRFDPATGRSRGVFAADSLRFPSDLAFGPRGDLYVSSAASGAVVRFDARTGEFVAVAARLPGSGGAPMGLAVLPDGAIVIGDFGRDRLYRVGASGAEPELLSDSGLAGPENVAIHPVP
jgi:DNA-binding beta-propeller fold protein YncE